MKTRKEEVVYQEMGEVLVQRVENLAIMFLIKHRKRLVSDYIKKNIVKFVGEDRLLTSEDVVEMLQISHQTLGRRIKQGKLIPVNLEAKRNYRFKRSDVYKLIEKKGE